MSKPPAYKAKPYLMVDDTTTESDAESNYQGWSDAGSAWPGSSSLHPRASTSSEEDSRSQSHSRNTSSSPSSLAVPHNGHGHGHSHSHAHTSPGPHRRAAPYLSAASSTLSLESVTTSSAAPPSYPSTILDIADSPVLKEKEKLDASTSASAYNVFAARSRRKSISQIPIPASSTNTESEDEGVYVPNSGTGTGAGGVSSSKGKKSKRGRGTSFSLPSYRKRRMSQASWLQVIEKHSRKASHYASRQTIAALVTFILMIIFSIKWWQANYELHYNISVYDKKTIQRPMETIQPLKGCWDPHNISPHYNLTKHLAPKHQLLSPGLSLRQGMSCYDFSSTIQSHPGQPLEHLTYHTYWRSDLIPFGERQTATLIAFLATQSLAHSKLILWTNGADILSANEHVKKVIGKWGEYIEVRQVDMKYLTKHTELEGVISGMDGGGLFDERAWVDGDAVRLLVLWHYGGIWMDMDQVLTRDLHPLAETEFVTQWDCYEDKEFFLLNGALMHFERHSPYLCEAFHIMASSPLPRPNTFSWGSFLYSKLHRRLLAAHVKPFSVLPWCFADPRNCREDVSFPDPFNPDPGYFGGRKWDGRGEVGRSGRELLEERLGHVWTLHLHNQWGKSFPKGGWLERLFMGFERQLSDIERFARGRTSSAGAGAGAGGGGGGGAGHNANSNSNSNSKAGGTGGANSDKIILPEGIEIPGMVGMDRAKDERERYALVQKVIAEEMRHSRESGGDELRDKEAALSKQIKVWYN